MRIKLLALLLTLILVFVGLAGCSNEPKKSRAELQESISKYIAGDITGKIGESYNTKWFEFTIHSIDKVDSFAGYEAKDDHQLYKVLIAEKNISDEILAMGTFDFYMDDPGFEEFIWAIAPLDDTMMPEEFDLKPGESAEYVMIFEVPVDTAELALMYTEYFENEGIGATFAIDVD